MESSKKSPPEGASNVAMRRLEAKSINVSLLALSSCVNALASKEGRFCGAPNPDAYRRRGLL